MPFVCSICCSVFLGTFYIKLRNIVYIHRYSYIIIYIQQFIFLILRKKRKLLKLYYMIIIKMVELITYYYYNVKQKQINQPKRVYLELGA